MTKEEKIDLYEAVNKIFQECGRHKGFRGDGCENCPFSLKDSETDYYYCPFKTAPCGSPWDDWFLEEFEYVLGRNRQCDRCGERIGDAPITIQFSPDPEDSLHLCQECYAKARDGLHMLEELEMLKRTKNG